MERLHQRYLNTNNIHPDCLKANIAKWHGLVRFNPKFPLKAVAAPLQPRQNVAVLHRLCFLRSQAPIRKGNAKKVNMCLALEMLPVKIEAMMSRTHVIDTGSYKVIGWLHECCELTVRKTSSMCGKTGKVNYLISSLLADSIK